MRKLKLRIIRVMNKKLTWWLPHKGHQQQWLKRKLTRPGYVTIMPARMTGRSSGAALLYAARLLRAHP